MANKKKTELSSCIQNNCFANEKGKCRILINTDFTGFCPFFKTQEQLDQEEAKCVHRLINL